MKFIEKVWGKISKPKPIALTIFYIFFAMLLAGTLTLVILVENQTVWNFLLYIISAVSLAYCVYSIVYIAPMIKEKIIAQLKKRKFTNTLLSSYGYRTIIFSIFSFSLNLTYVIFMAVLAFMTKSAWYIAITVYYLVLILMKGNVLYFKYAERKHSKNMKILKSKRENRQDDKEIEIAGVNKSESFHPEVEQAKTYRYCGIMFIFLTLALSGIIVLIYTSNMYFEYAGLLIYAVAAFTFYKLTLAIINLFKARKQTDLYVQSIRNINLASALVSIVVLQVALIQAFSPSNNASFAHGITAGLVSAMILALGIYMILKANKQLKIKEKEKYNG